MNNAFSKDELSRIESTDDFLARYNIKELKSSIKKMENKIDTLFPLAISNGGTGATNTAGALSSLGIPIETGTFTPTLINSDSAGVPPTVTAASGYTMTMDGYYWRFGRFVMIYITLQNFAITTVNGTYARIGGLPFYTNGNFDIALNNIYGTGVTTAGGDIAFYTSGRTLIINNRMTTNSASWQVIARSFITLSGVMII